MMVNKVFKEFKVSRETKEYLRMVRRTNRHKLPMRIRMGIRSGSPGVPALSLMGYSRDISVGGICAVVDPADANTAMGLQHILNQKVALALPSGTMALSVVGKYASGIRNTSAEHHQVLAESYGSVDP